MDRRTGRPPSWRRSAACGSTCSFCAASCAAFRPRDGSLLWHHDEAADYFNRHTANRSRRLDLHRHRARPASNSLLQLQATQAVKSPSKRSTINGYSRRPVSRHGRALLAIMFIIVGSRWLRSVCGIQVGRDRLAGAAVARARGRASWTYADGRLYMRHSDGHVTLVEATPKELRRAR